MRSEGRAGGVSREEQCFVKSRRVVAPEAKFQRCTRPMVAAVGEPILVPAPMQLRHIDAKHKHSNLTLRSSMSTADQRGRVLQFILSELIVKRR